MKRLLAVFLFALACYPSFASAKEQTDRSRPNRWRLEYRDATGISTEAVSVDADGNFLPGDNYQTSIGESSHSWKKVWTGSLYVASGIVNVLEVYPNLLVGTTDVAKEAATAGVFARGFVISTRSLEAPTTNNLSNQATTYITTDFNQSSFTPRNVILYSVAASSWGGLGQTTTTLSGSATFYGIDSLGKANWEQISFSTTIPPQMGGVALSSHVGVGNIAWATISSVTIQVTSMTQNTDDFAVGAGVAVLNIAWGNKIGLINQIDSASDIYMVSHGPVTADATNETVYFAIAPNSSNTYRLRYKARTSTP